MAIAYELGVSTVAAANAAAYAEFRCNGTRRAKVREVGMFSQAATAAAKTQLGRPGNTPAGGTVTVGGAQDPGDAAAVSGITTTWSTAPTVPATAFRQWDFNNVIGSGVVFTWPSDGELVAGSSVANGLVVWNGGSAAGPACDLYMVWSE